MIWRICCRSRLKRTGHGSYEYEVDLNKSRTRSSILLHRRVFPPNLPQVELDKKTTCWGGQREDFSGGYTQLQCYRLTRLPQEGQFLKLSDDLSFRQSTDDLVQGEGEKIRFQGTKISYEFVATSKTSMKDAQKKVDDFLDAAYIWYLDQKKDEIDNRWAMMGREDVLMGGEDSCPPRRVYENSQLY